jgi:3-hydroxyacyl-[acyl-carrier-protein] dehydratase
MLNIQEIKKWNPQRHPILLVDKILEIVPEQYIVARKAITATEQCFSHVEDDAPLESMSYPYSLLIESFCQATGPLCAQSGMEFIGKTILFASMNGIEFVDKAYPGDVIEHKAWITKVISDAVVMRGESWVDDRLIARYNQLVVVARNKTLLS